MNNDFSESPRIHTSGVLPMRRSTAQPDLKSNDPALRAMTDFKHKCPISVSPDRRIDDALTDMIRFGVRALLVVSGEHVVGLITSYDIEGPRPLKFLQRSKLERRDGIRVADIMTGWEDLPTMEWSTMQSARIFDLLEIFQGVGVMHLLVVEGEHASGSPVVRGLISRSQIERRLNLPDDLPQRAASRDSDQHVGDGP